MSEVREHLLRHTRRAADLGLRALGNRVLLRRVRPDTDSIIVQQNQNESVVHLGEVVSLGPRWEHNIPWLAALPWPTEDKYRSGVLKDGTLDPDWKPSEYTGTSPSWQGSLPTCVHVSSDSLHVEDVVLFLNPRILNSFHWMNEDILVYPGNWILGVVTGTYVSDNPDLRRYEPENFSMPESPIVRHDENQERVYRNRR